MKNIIKKAKGLLFVIRDYFIIKKQLKNNKDFKITKFLVIVWDKFDQSGTASWAYFHQDLLVARKIFENNPKKHVDIGSRVDGFVAHVAVFREIEVFDIRPLEKLIKNISFKQADLMKIDESLSGYCDSISSLHALEHFWLWRYWDEIDVNGHLKWLDNIYKILKKWWVFYFSVPIWPQRIEFNGQRVFSIKYLLNIFQNNYILKNFSYVDDNGDLYENFELSNHLIENNLNCTLWCGIFELEKK